MSHRIAYYRYDDDSETNDLHVEIVVDVPRHDQNTVTVMTGEQMSGLLTRVIARLDAL